MIEWIDDNNGVFKSAANIGITKHDNKYYMIDTGIDNSAVNKVLKSVDKSFSGAFITHHHADHMGGCSKLASLGINEIYGPKGELELISNTVLEPYSMFGGGWPPKVLRNRHLQAKSYPSIQAFDENHSGIIVKCPGHTPDHTALVIDRYLFSGDAAFTQETIDKYKLLFAINPQEAAKSIDILKSTKFDIMIPGHGPISHDRKTAEDVMNATKEHYISIAEQVLQIIGEKLEYEKFLKTVMKSIGVYEIAKERGLTQFYLFQVPLFGYLSNLMDQKKLKIEFYGEDLYIIAN